MAYEDPCPNCGHHRKRYLMSSNPDAPGFGGVLRGEGEDPLLIRVAWIAVLVVMIAAVAFLWGTFLSSLAL